MTDENNKRDLLSMKTIREAAAAIAAFEPERLPIGNEQFVTINKLPDDKFRELLNRFGSLLAPYLDVDENTRKKLTGEATLELLQQLPAFVDDLLKNATDWHSLAKNAQLPTDARLICAAAVLYVSFIDNAAVRVFTSAARHVNASVAAENAAVASDAQPTTERN